MRVYALGAGFRSWSFKRGVPGFGLSLAGWDFWDYVQGWCDKVVTILEVYGIWWE